MQYYGVVMKKYLSVFFAFLLLFLLIVPTFALSADVMTDSVSATAGETFRVKVKLSGNPGIIGLKISVDYPMEKVKAVSVSRGEILKKGNFNTNMGINDGHFDVLWSNSENIYDDGVLFEAAFKVQDNVTEDFQITLSYSAEDTFNEAWDDVTLNCRPISVHLLSSEAAEKTEPSTETLTQAETVIQLPSPTEKQLTMDDSDILNAVDTALESSGIASVDDIGGDKQEVFLQIVNENLSKAGGSDGSVIQSFDEMKTVYTQAYIENFKRIVLENVETKTIIDTLQKGLTSVGAQSFETVQETRKGELIQTIDAEFANLCAQIPPLSGKLEDATAFEVLWDLYQDSVVSLKNSSAEIQNTQKNAQKHVIWIIVISLIVVVAIIGVILYFYQKKKAVHNNNNKETFEKRNQ